MVRLHGMDLEKLKPEQLLWYIEEPRLGIRRVYCYKYLEKVGRRNGKVWHRLFCYQNNRSVKTYFVGLKDKNCTIYLAKVTRKEEPEFIARILEF